MSKTILFKDEAKEKMLRGLNIVADAVGGTLGPRGLNAIIEKPYQNLITNDGATVAANIELPDKFENMGAAIVRNVSSQTNDDAGDGTTTTAVLLQAIVKECLARKENPMEIRESLIKAGKEAVEILKKKSIPIKDGDLESVALISAENPELASLIVGLVKKLGNDVVINVEDSKTFESSAEVMPGYDAPVGFLSPYFINQKETGKAVFEDVHVLVAEKKLSSLTDLRPIAKQFEEKGIGQCVFVVDDIDESMLGLLAVNNAKGIFKCVVVKAHGEVLEDIEGAVGARAVSDRNGLNYQNIKIEDLGKAQKVIVDANKSVFLGANVSGSIRASQLDGMAESEENEYRKKKLKDRAAKLRGGIGILRIGSSSDYERDYLKLKAEDAIKAVQAAQEEGIVEGGGMALARVSREIDNNTIGGSILQYALTAPIKKIFENAGKDFSSVIFGGEGYDAKNDTFVDLIEAGIIDPTKVERCALQNALAAASTFITTFVAITENEPTKA